MVCNKHTHWKSSVREEGGGCRKEVMRCLSCVRRQRALPVSLGSCSLGPHPAKQATLHTLMTGTPSPVFSEDMEEERLEAVLRPRVPVPFC